MNNGHPLLQEIRLVVQGARSRQDLEQLLLSNLQGILSSNDKDAISLANELDAMFIDLGEGIISSEEFDDQLEAILEREASTVRGVMGQPVYETVGEKTIRKHALMPPQPQVTIYREVHVPS